MSFKHQKIMFKALHDWFLSEQGKGVGEAFTKALNPLTGILSGNTLLQLGNYGDNAWLHDLTYRHKWLATPYWDSTSTTETLFNYIALDSNTVDCIVAPLTLQAFTKKKSPIDEMDRILKPMGYLVIFGINPMSLWGIYMRLGLSSCFNLPDFSRKAMSCFYLKKTMFHRNYLQCYSSSFYFIPPIQSTKWLQRLEFLNRWGEILPGGFYCLVMQKLEVLHPDLLSRTIGKALFARSMSLQL